MGFDVYVLGEKSRCGKAIWTGCEEKILIGLVKRRYESWEQVGEEEEESECRPEEKERGLGNSSPVTRRRSLTADWFTKK